MKVNNVIIIVSIIFFYLIVCYLCRDVESNHYLKEGMCSIEDSNEDSSVETYYGQYGSVVIRTETNGDKYCVSVNFNSDVNESEVSTMTVYGPNGSSVNIYQGENGEWLIVDSVDEQSGDTVTYYGSNGYVVVETRSDGTREIIDYNTSYTNNSTSVNIYYGPNGTEVNVIRTSDGTLRLVTGYNGNNSVVYNNRPYNRRSDYILKSEVVPPVCPTCPAVNYCGNKCGDIDNATECPETTTDTTNTSTTNTVTGPQGGSITQTTDSSGNKTTTITKGDGESATVTNEDGVITVQKDNDPLQIGSLLNKYSSNAPMPVLSDFSKF
jgi:hypothetical protein